MPDAIHLKHGASRGVLLVAAGHRRYLQEAVIAAGTVKDVLPRLPVCLFTDQPDDPLCRLRCLDSVQALDGATESLAPWMAGQLARVRAMQLTPFDETLHLDTDMRIMHPDFARVFEHIEGSDIAMVEEDAAVSFSRRASNIRMFNVGFILYRKTPRVHLLLAQWERRSARNFHLASEPALDEPEASSHAVRRKLLTMDQISLAEILGPETDVFGVACKQMASRWNFRSADLHHCAQRGVVIAHVPRYQAGDHTRLLRDVLYRYQPRTPYSQPHLRVGASG